MMNVILSTGDRSHVQNFTFIEASSTGDSLVFDEVIYTGWTLSTGFGLEFASRCSDVCTRWLLNTCLPTANPSPASLAVATCDRLTVVISTFHVWNLLRTENVHLHMPALRIGTHFLLTLRLVYSDATQLNSMSSWVASAGRYRHFADATQLNWVELRRYRHPHWVTTFRTDRWQLFTCEQVDNSMSSWAELHRRRYRHFADATQLDVDLSWVVSL